MMKKFLLLIREDINRLEQMSEEEVKQDIAEMNGWVEELAGFNNFIAGEPRAVVIAYLHASTLAFEEADWRRIANLYEKLVKLNPSPFTKLGQAAALYFGGDEAVAVPILN